MCVGCCWCMQHPRSELGRLSPRCSARVVFRLRIPLPGLLRRGDLEALVGLITDEFSLSDSNPYTVCGVRGGEKEPGAEPPTQPLVYRFDFTADL